MVGAGGVGGGGTEEVVLGISGDEEKTGEVEA